MEWTFLKTLRDPSSQKTLSCDTNGVSLAHQLCLVFGPPRTCVYPDVCLGIAHVSGKVPLPGQGVWQIHYVSAPFAPRNL